MTIAEYQTLTGTTVATTDEVRMKAVIRRSESRLETLLGYSLSKQKKWSELGKVQYSGLVPFPSLPLGDAVIANLLPPDDQTGNYQLFHFDERDTHLRINPAKEVYSAKLVLPVDSDEFVTVAELNNVTPYLNQAGLVTALTRYTTWFGWTWWTSLSWSSRSKLMLAVDASYVNVCDVDKYPDLAYLLADMATYYSDPNYSLVGNLRSESIDSNSYSRASTGTTPDKASPEGQASSIITIEKYAGPAAFRKRIA